MYRTCFFLSSIVLACIISGPLQARILEFGISSEQKFGAVHLQNTEIFRAHDNSWDIRMKTQHYQARESNLLYLDFNQKLVHLLKDQAGRYSIKKSDYILAPQGYLGKRAALFNRKDNHIQIESRSQQWPLHEQIGSFTIEMWCKPIFYYRHNSLFMKWSYTSGQKKGLELYIKNGYLHFDALKLFKNRANQEKSLALVSRKKLKLKKWQHLALSYDAHRGRIALYIDGQLEDIQHTRDQESIWQAQLDRDDLSPIFIARNYSGYLDELRVSSHAGLLENVNLHTSRYPRVQINYQNWRSTQNTGEVVSEIIALNPTEGLGDGQLYFDVNHSGGSQINLWVRFSSRPFQKNLDTNTLPWQAVYPNRILRLHNMGYLQWKAQFKASPNGKNSAVLKSIRLEHQAYPVPPYPRNLRIVAELSTNNAICLEWDRSSRQSVSQGGGYRMYYGLTADEMAGFLDLPANSPWIKKYNDAEFYLSESEKKLRMQFPHRFKKQFQSRLRFMLTNKQIIQQIHSHNKNLPLLQSDRMYYFSITAYNKRKLESAQHPVLNFYLNHVRFTELDSTYQD